MLAADAAEALGDAAEALRIMDSRPLGPDGRPFWRPWRIRRLIQLSTLSSVLPRWVTSRWILAQALQASSESARARALKALRIAERFRDGAGSPPAVDDIEAKCRVIDRDWVFRQVYLYELGGLDDFLRGAAPALLARADRIRAWARAGMGGYQLVGREPATVIWRTWRPRRGSRSSTRDVAPWSFRGSAS